MSDTKTGIVALNEMLFQQLEKLQNDDLTAEELETEIKRADAVKGISTQILEGQKLAFNLMKHRDEYGYKKDDFVPKMLEVNG